MQPPELPGLIQVSSGLVVVESDVLAYSRRSFLRSSLAGIACASTVLTPAVGQAEPSDVHLSPSLLRRALAALEQHHASIADRHILGIADFSLPSRTPRFYVVNVASGGTRAHWVAHGRGSDPSHTGWLERFSNEPKSNATSAGAYKTGNVYVGSHGHSMRLEGLDPSNSNALSRALVVHGAWYVSERMIGYSGMLGRSQGCLAVADSSLPEIMAQLGPGRLIYAGKA